MLTLHFPLSRRSLETSVCKDEISLLVEQEYLSLTQENATELEMQRSEEDKAIASASLQTSSNNYLTTPLDGEQVLEDRDAMENVYRVLTGNKKEMKPRSICDVQQSTKSTVTGILLPAKYIYKSAKNTSDNGSSNAMGSNTQIAKLLAQFPLKRVEASKALESKMMAEETKLIKDLLHSNMFGAVPHKDNIARQPPLMTAMESQGSGQKKQLPVFAKICSKSESELVADGLCQSTGKHCGV